MIDPTRDWPLAPASCALGPEQIHVWAFSLQLPAPALAHLQQTLDPMEAAKLERLRVAHVRDRYIAAHGTLRAILADYLGTEPRQLRFEHGPHGKPALTGPHGGLCFNLSHSHNVGLVAVAADREVGVDVEWVRADLEASKLAWRFFTEDEAAQLDAWPEAQRALGFCLAWTVKEAVTKAQGKAIFHEIKNIPVDLRPEQLGSGRRTLYGLDNRDWAAACLPMIADRYAVALAAAGNDWVAQCRLWQQ